jgi:hypothetical protein
MTAAGANRPHRSIARVKIADLALHRRNPWRPSVIQGTAISRAMSDLMHRSAAAHAWVMLLAAMMAGSAAAERSPTEEETIAPQKQNCWGGIIRYVADEKKFEVEDAVCADGRFYHLATRGGP